MKDKHYYDVDCHKPGSKGFKKINVCTGQEDIRMKPIPTQSGLAARLGKIVNSKQSRKGKWEP